MRLILHWLAFSAIASAKVDPRHFLHKARSPPRALHSRASPVDSQEPCAILSSTFESARADPDNGLITDIPPSVGIACLKSVPLDRRRSLALLEYLEPYIEFQSTTEILADPPNEYLVPGVDIFGGLLSIRQRLIGGEYNTQYEVMTDLRSIFTAAADNHFGYDPALLNAFMYIRPALNFTAISWDGIETPKILHALDVERAGLGQLDYRASPVKEVNGMPVHQFLERDAVENTYNYQDPDAQYNNQFTSIPGSAVGKAGAALIHAFEVPDNYTITFWNGSWATIPNELYFLPGVDFTGIDSGAKFRQALELPSSNSRLKPRSNGGPKLPKIKSRSKVMPLYGYPRAVIQDSGSSVAGFFLAGEEYKDTAVLTILSFEPTTSEVETMEEAGEYVTEVGYVVAKFYALCKKYGKTKLVIDLSTNGGGLISLANHIYRLTFPKGEFNNFDRYRANEALEAVIQASYPDVVDTLISTDQPMSTENKPIVKGDEFFGPEFVEGQNMTTAFQSDKTEPFGNPNKGGFINGFDPKYKPLVARAPFDPENILVVTDGVCASACNILTGLLTRVQGVRTLALGGRAIEGPMQAMGGVKGTLISNNVDLFGGFGNFVDVVRNDKTARKILSDAADVLPSFDPAPLQPMIEDYGSGSVNSLNSYTADDLDGYPVHFRYEAANCRLFYTQQMVGNVAETWRRAAGVAWNAEPCVRGSTTNADNTIGDKTVKFNTKVKSRVGGIQGPGSLTS